LEDPGKCRINNNVLLFGFVNLESRRYEKKNSSLTFLDSISTVDMTVSIILTVFVIMKLEFGLPEETRVAPEMLVPVAPVHLLS
jgi:hypothetical protein